MARVCDFTWQWTRSWNTRSHSMRSAKRTFKPNLIYRKIQLDDGTTMKIKISSKIYKKLKGFI